MTYKDVMSWDNVLATLLLIATGSQITVGNLWGGPNPPTPEEWILTDWQTYNLPPEDQRHRSNQLKQLRRGIAEAIFGVPDGGTPLSFPDQSANNFKLWLKELRSGKSAPACGCSLPEEVKSLTVIPIACLTAGTTQYYLSGVHTLTGEILGLVKKSESATPKEWFRALWLETSRNLGEITNPTARFKLGLSADTILTRQDQASEQCLNLAVGALLRAEGFRVTADTQTEVLEGLRTIYAPEQHPARSTHRLKLRWQPFTGGEPKGTMAIADAIFGERVFGPIIFEGVTSLTPKILSPLRDLKASLDTNSLPRVVSIRGGWAYLDKGRAWGLKISDRLVSAEGGDIQGHIVQFYGLSEKLTTESGGVVSDGAILFVRKGQHDVKLGSQFQYDPATYPTPHSAN